MATFNRINNFSRDLADKLYDLNSDTFRWMLTNTAPVASNATRGDITEIATGGGYTQSTGAGAGGLTTTLSFALVGAQTTVSVTQAQLVATGAVATFRYAVLFDESSGAGAATRLLVGWIDHGVAITMANTDTYTIPAGAIMTIG